LSFKFLFYSLFALGALLRANLQITTRRHADRGSSSRQQMTRIFQKVALIHFHTPGKQIKLTNWAQFV
jgi:hypothetical protein